MRILTLWTVLILTVILTGAALGEAAPRSGGDPAVVFEPAPVAGPNATHLKLSPLFLEILAIDETYRTTELFLLNELAAVTDPVEAGRIVRSLERLEMDRNLKILRTRMRHARLNGRFDLAARLKREIITLQSGEVHAGR